MALRKAQTLEKLNRRGEALQWLRDRRPPASLAVRWIEEQAAIEADLGRFAEADRDLRNALALSRSSGQARMTAVLQVRRARVLIRLAEPDQADEALSRAEDYVRASGDRQLVPFILNYRGFAALARNRSEEAIAPLQQSLDLFRKDPTQQALAAQVMISLASAYYRLGRINDARSLYEQAFRLSLPEDRHLALGHLGDIFYSEGDFTNAARNFRQAASLAKGRDQHYYFEWLANLATTLIDRGNCEEAERVNREVLQTAEDISNVHEAQVNQGRVEACLGRYQAAEPLLRQVTASREGDQSFVFDAYRALARMYTQMGRTESVKPEFESALALADQTSGKLREDENKLSYLSSLIALNQDYVDFLMSRGDAPGALAIAESSRARLLRERLNLPSSRTHRHTVGEYCAAARAAGVTFLAYWIGPQRSYLWAISGSGFTSYRLPPETEIRRLVEPYQSAIERGGPLRPEETAAGAKLFEALLPAAVRKAGARYIIVPDGPLYALNFETLPVPGERPHYWIEDATVALAPSLDMLLDRPARPSRARSVLLVGDAAEWNPEYPRLLHAREEMQGIENLFPAVERKVLAGSEATPSAYLQSKPEDYEYIHFTAHATANKNSPFDSAVILSQGPAGGKLSVRDVLNTHVDAELVTISACHSAGARTYEGEGLVGFAWAFLESGAHGVIAGLWDVSDYSSPLLMRKLYAGLKDSRAPAGALRAAKLDLIRGGKYADPYYWGAFQLYEGTLEGWQAKAPAPVRISSVPRPRR
ncbi:MAG TPA: CHAT domain-containing protein [Bryobacteraceae bacterium]|nr:CHAT domain-containing protein [Bryobacteraceae bacterium]